MPSNKKACYFSTQTNFELKTRSFLLDQKYFVSQQNILLGKQNNFQVPALTSAHKIWWSAQLQSIFAKPREFTLALTATEIVAKTKTFEFLCKP